MVMAARWYELDTRRSWWLCAIPIWSGTYVSAVALSQNICSIWRCLYRHGCRLGLDFEGIPPDRFDIVGAAIALAGVAIIFYMPRKREGEKAVWSKK